MRALCERALAAAGLHFTEGGKVWEAYREFEQALLISMVEASHEVCIYYLVCMPYHAEALTLLSCFTDQLKSLIMLPG
jgi:hypothetical protein